MKFFFIFICRNMLEITFFVFSKRANRTEDQYSHKGQSRAHTHKQIQHDAVENLTFEKLNVESVIA